MTEQRIILSRLLDKFENSKHLSDPGTSHRRVMLRVDKKELPEYRYEDATTRDAYNEAARMLEAKQLVQLEWVKGRPLLSTVVLNLEGLDVDIAQRIIDFTSGSCYAISGNLQKISHYIFIITPASVDVSGDFQDIFGGAFDSPISTNLN